MLGFKNQDKKWHMELLLLRLRTNANQQRSFQELSKAMRMTLLEKRYGLDSVEKSNLQKSLDLMQHCIKVTSKQGLENRLENLTRQLGLSLMVNTTGIFISSDMFYLEITLDNGGKVQDVKVHHECKIEQQSCTELVNCLTKGDFTDFTAQLEGLASIYQLNAEPKIKSKAFVVLQALETDIIALSKFQNYHKDINSLLLQSYVGVVQKRMGGHPMKLTYFLSPFELLDLSNKKMNIPSIDLIKSKNIGLYVTINLEASTTKKLQIVPILSTTKESQSNPPAFHPLTAQNSTVLPASFVLRLNKPMTLCSPIIEQIVAITELNFCELKNAAPILGVMTKNAFGEDTNNERVLYVSLPDQNHCYILTENMYLKGIVVNCIPFTEPGQVPKILNLLRQQAAFNTLVESCMRLNSKKDPETSFMFEMSALSHRHVVVTLEHPIDETIATVEFNLSNISSPTCKLSAFNRNFDSLAANLSNILRTTFSIPVTLRALIKIWKQENSVTLENKKLFSQSFNIRPESGDNSAPSVADFNSLEELTTND